MDTSTPYTKRDVSYAVNCSAIAAWGIVEVVISAEIGFSTLPWNTFWGLPIAFIAVWIFAAPFIRIAMRDNVTYVQAARLGLTITAVCAFVFTVLTRINDLLARANRWEQLDGGALGRRLTVDGYLTTAGARQVLDDVVIYLCIGIIIGLIVRAIAGPGRTFEAEQSLRGRVT